MGGTNIKISLKMKEKANGVMKKILQNEKKCVSIISIGYSIKHMKHKNFFVWKNVFFPVIIRLYFHLKKNCFFGHKQSQEFSIRVK